MDGVVGADEEVGADLSRACVRRTASARPRPPSRRGRCISCTRRASAYASRPRDDRAFRGAAPLHADGPIAESRTFGGTGDDADVLGHDLLARVRPERDHVGEHSPSETQEGHETSERAIVSWRPGHPVLFADRGRKQSDGRHAIDPSGRRDQPATRGREHSCASARPWLPTTIASEEYMRSR